MTVVDLIELLEDLEPNKEVYVLSADTRSEPAKIIRASGPVVVIFSENAIPPTFGSPA